MTDKEFRRLSRADLIEIIYELQKSERNMQDEIAELKQKLEERRVAIEESGSLAEVLAKLNGLFEAAQATADDYRREAEQLLEEARQTREQADAYMADTRQKASELARRTIKKREQILAKTEEECRQLLAAAQRGQRPKQSRQQDGEAPDLDEILLSVKEGRYDGGRET